MATFWAVSKSAAPVHNGRSFSDTYFLRHLQPHAIAVEFDPNDESNGDVYIPDWNYGEYPANFVHWAEKQGRKAGDYFFIIAGTHGNHVDSDWSDDWPTSVDEIWASWENIEGHCVATSTLQFRLGYIQKEVNTILDKLQNLVY